MNKISDDVLLQVALVNRSRQSKRRKINKSHSGGPTAINNIPVQKLIQSFMGNAHTPEKRQVR